MAWLVLWWLSVSPAQAQFFPGQGGGFPGQGFPPGGAGQQPQEPEDELPGGGVQWGELSVGDTDRLPPCDEFVEGDDTDPEASTDFGAGVDTAVVACYPSGLKGAADIAGEPGGCMTDGDQANAIGLGWMVVTVALFRRARRWGLDRSGAVRAEPGQVLSG